MTRTTKIWSAVLIFLVLAAGTALFLAWGKKVAMENVFPSQPVFYVRLDHAAQNITKAGESSFWKSASAIDITRVMARNNVPKAQVMETVNFLDGVNMFIRDPWAQRIFGKEIAFGYYDGGGFLFAVRLGASVRAAELVSRLGTQWGDGVETSSQDYKGDKIITVNIKKKGVAFKYVRFKDILVAAPPSSGMLERVADVYHKNGPGLGADSNFAFVVDRAYPKGQGLAYVNAQAMDNVLKRQAAARDMQDVGEIFAQTAWVRSYGLSFLPGKVNHWKFIMGVDPALMAPEAREAMACPASTVPVAFVPPGIITYQWGGCYDFKQTWERLREQAQAVPPAMQEQVRGFKHRLEKRWKVNIASDVLPLLGNEAGGYLTDVDTTGMFPYPRFLVFLKIKDRVRIEGLLAKLTEHSLMPVLDEDYARVRIRYAAFPLGANMDPGYCFIGDYLLLSSSRQLLKKSIDTSFDASRSLGADKTARAFGLSAPEKANAVAFVRLDALAARARDLLDWADRYMSSQLAQAAAFKQESEEKKEGLARAIAAKSAELTLAERKIKEKQTKASADAAQEDPSLTQDAIANLAQEAQGLRDDIKDYAAQRDELNALAAQYQSQAESAKLWMFNSQHVAVPLLKGLEAMRALGVKMNVGGRSLETEIFLN